MVAAGNNPPRLHDAMIAKRTSSGNGSKRIPFALSSSGFLYIPFAISALSYAKSIITTFFAASIRSRVGG